VNCHETHDLLHTYVDRALDVVRDVAIAERHATRPVCAATSGAGLPEHPSATRWRTRLPWGVHARASRGGAAPCGAHRSTGWGGAAWRVRGRDTRRWMGQGRTCQGWSGRSGREKAAGESSGRFRGNSSNTWNASGPRARRISSNRIGTGHTPPSAFGNSSNSMARLRALRSGSIRICSGTNSSRI
jgi:hypothetical protein